MRREEGELNKMRIFKHQRLSKKFAWSIRLVSVLALSAGLTACGMKNRSNALDAINAQSETISAGSFDECNPFNAIEADPELIANFAGGLHTTLRNNCRECHGKQISAQFAVRDAGKAWQAAGRFIDIRNAAESMFVRQIIEKPTHGNCRTCAGKGPEIQSAIQGLIDFLVARGSDSDLTGANLPAHCSEQDPDELPRPDGGVALTPITLSNLPTAPGTYRTYDWPLDSSTTPAGQYAGAIFRIDVKVFGDGGSAYEFRNPRILTPSATIEVEGISLWVNGRLDRSAATYTTVNQTLAPDNAEAILSPASMIVVGDPQADVIQFVFDKLQAI